MEEEKTLAIPLGGSTSDGERVDPSAASADPTSAAASSSQQKSGKSSGRNEKLQKSAKANVKKKESKALAEKDSAGEGDGKPKKPGIAARIFKTLGALLIFLLVVSVIGGVVLLFLATRDEMPTAPEIKSDITTIAVDSALDALKDQEIRLNSDELNLFLNMVKEKSADKTAEHGVEIIDLFTVVASDKATIYSRIKYKGITWPVRAVAKLSFDDPYIIVSMEKAYLGSLNLPSEKIIEFVGKYIVNDNISVHNGMIYYDTTEFNDKITEVTIKQLGLEVDEREVQDDQDKNAIEKWWNNFVDGITGWFKNWAAGLVSDIIHDLKFKNVTIIDNEVVIQVSYAEG